MSEAISERVAEKSMKIKNSLDPEQENHDGSYLTASMATRSWSLGEWKARRNTVAKVWERNNEVRRKELLAALVAHAPEVC
jgi:hypothetical protein